MKQSLEWWNVNSESNPRVGPRVLGLHPNGLFSLHYCYVKITIFHPVVSKIKLRFYLKPGNREPMFECWDESGSEHPDMVPHRGVWSKENTHRILWRQYFSMLLCTGSEHHSANLSQFLMAQRCVPLTVELETTLMCF